MTSLEGCVPNEIVDFAGRLSTLGEVVFEVTELPCINRAMLAVWREGSPSPVRASHLMLLSGRQDFKDYIADLKRQVVLH
ncbi:hypothetical protein [Methylovirgula sp. 4M-Z18]|uniref:hypothetical protein n=1 Tax=Methylovirgula sp. 4M-Z18 TaxID=2293567 RepID=UPI000E2F8C10|nr:hypothetical protein [Methylovirgula sp. 4M-Z18]RFB79684.1 hypothetical protein DYH55_09380 [Methylovirgula sp. 4M-Z18]